MNEKKLQGAEHIKDKILVTAESEFSEYGYFGARVDSIAERSGVNKRIIYQHFESKNNLYSKVLLRVCERLAERERDFMTNELSPVDAVRNIITVSFNFLKDDPSFVRMLMWENLNRENIMNEGAFMSLKKPSFDYIRSQIKRGQDEGIFRNNIDTEQVVLSLNNFCLSYFSSIYTSGKLLSESKDDDRVSTYSAFVSDVIIRYLTE